MIRLTLPYPPSANRYWRRHGNVIHRSNEADAYKEQVGWLCNAAQVTPITGDVTVALDFYRPAKRGDLDNLLKVVFDSLNGFAYGDDQQIAEIHAMRHDDPKDPRVEVSIQEVAK